MVFLAKGLVVAVLALAFAAPMVMHDACGEEHAGEEHDATVPTACVCACHGAANIANVGLSVPPDAPSGCQIPPDVPFPGRLVITEVYRPPISC